MLESFAHSGDGRTSGQTDKQTNVQNGKPWCRPAPLGTGKNPKLLSIYLVEFGFKRNKKNIGFDFI